MANEVTVSATLKYAKAKVSNSLSTSYSATQTGDKYEAGVQIIGTTEEQLAKNDIGTIGFVAVRNMDATNYVQLGAATGAYSVKLLAGEGCVLPFRAANVFILANTAPVEVEYLLVEL